MTTLLMFVIGLILIIGFARYNKSNRLFWILLISFLSGIASASIYNTCTNQNKSENKVTLTKSTPTYLSSLDNSYCLMKIEDEDINTPKAKSVSKFLLNSDCTYFRSSKDEEIPILTRMIPTIRGQCTTNFVYDTS